MNKNQIEIRCLATEIRASENSESRTVEGYAAKFDKWSQPICGWFKEQIDRGAFNDCDMSDVIMCFNHNPSDLMARTSSGTLELSVDEVGLRFKFEFPDTTLGNDVLALVKRGDISQCSFRFFVESDSWIYADSDNDLELDERTILKISKLSDVSLVTFPAYKDTEVNLRHLEEARDKYKATKQPPFNANKAAQRKRNSQFLSLKNN